MYSLEKNNSQHQKNEKAHKMLVKKKPVGHKRINKRLKNKSIYFIQDALAHWNVSRCQVFVWEIQNFTQLSWIYPFYLESCRAWMNGEVSFLKTGNKLQCIFPKYYRVTKHYIQ